MNATQTDYQNHFPDLLFKALKRGGTVRDFCREIKINKTKFYRWVRRYPDFARALETGREAARELWLIRCKIPDYNPVTGKRYPNTSYHRLLAANIYGRDFLPSKRKVTREERSGLEINRILLNAGF